MNTYVSDRISQVKPAMSFTIERLIDPDAYLVTLLASFDPATEMRPYFEQLSAKLDTEIDPITSIVDIRELTFSFSDLLVTTRDLQGMMQVNPTKHPLSEQFIIVSEHKLMRASLSGFQRFGILRETLIVSTVEDALATIRNQDDNTNLRHAR